MICYVPGKFVLHHTNGIQQLGQTSGWDRLTGILHLGTPSTSGMNFRQNLEEVLIEERDI